MAIGETFLSAFLQALFEQMLSSGGRQFLKMVGGVDLPKTIKKWKIQLTRLEALLDDAELQQFHSKPVKLWLNDLRDLAYDIEDLLDHFAIEAQRYQFKKAEDDRLHASTTDNMVQNIYARAASGLSTLFSPIDQDIQDKIDEITERLQDIQDQTQSLSLTAAHMMQQTLQTEILRSQRESTSLVCEVFGRDKNKQEIITQLLKDEQNGENYVVIPIVGTGGIGKTTLAQYVYNDEQLKGYFDLKAWVCISDVFDVKRVTIDIINSATKNNFDCSNLDQAQLKLQEVLNGNKFFIVLDDIWSENYADWDRLQIPFGGGAKGSRVIMTTRIEKIAKKMTKNHSTIICLQGLSDDNIWHLFKHHAYEYIDDLEIKDDIIWKCKGLPLAAKALGGLLKSTTEKSQRRHILESNVWGQEYEECEVLPVLRLSYHHLPSNLKRVFAYCSVFPKDYKFNEMELVLLWMAQGFLPGIQNVRMEDMGHKYFNDLVSRSLFGRLPSDEGKYIMHDLIHDVAQLAAGEVCYVMDSKKNYPERIRHLFITQHVQTLGNESMFPQLRTCLYNNYITVDSLDFIQRMHYIRALRLVSDRIEVLPDCIGDLKHLRYLSLRFRRIKVLPQSISNLWNLQTLCLKGCLKLEKIPHIGSLEKLRHMYITRYSSMVLGWRNFDDFTYEEISLTEMPLGIGKLIKLQTLGQFVLADGGGSKVRELGMLNHLRGRLNIFGLGNVTEVADAQEAQLYKKESLDELYMGWGIYYIDEVDDMTKRGVLEKLQPHTNIKECELYGYMGSTFPSWLGDLSYNNMVHVTLMECCKCEFLPPLGQLCSLKSLWIEYAAGIKEVGLEFYGHCIIPFPSLEGLHFSLMHSWKKWLHPPVGNKAFPNLERLSISDCPSLQGDLPPHLPSLRKLEIKGCMQLQSLELKISSSSNSCLEELLVNRCESMVSIRHIPLTLQLLGIYDCKKLGCVEFDEQPTNLSPQSDDMKCLKSEESIGVSPKASLELPLLTHFTIEDCPSLRSLQQSLFLPALPTLELWYFENMEKLPAQLFNFTSLKKLCIDGCPKIHSFPEGGLPRNLTFLKITNVNIKQGIQEWRLHLLYLLEVLVLKNVGSSVDSVECIKGPGLCLHSSLHKLCIEGFQNLKSIANGTTLPNLTNLNVKDCPSLDSLLGDFTSLTDLSIEECPSLESLVSDFTSLTHLFIKNCPEFHNLPEGGLPTNLRWLEIRGTNIDKPIKEWGLHLHSSLKYLTLENVGSSGDTLESISFPDFPSSLFELNIEGFQNLKTICCSTLHNLSSVNIKHCPILESLGNNGLPPYILNVKNLKLKSVI